MEAESPAMAVQACLRAAGEESPARAVQACPQTVGVESPARAVQARLWVVGVESQAVAVPAAMAANLLAAPPRWLIRAGEENPSGA